MKGKKMNSKRQENAQNNEELERVQSVTSMREMTQIWIRVSGLVACRRLEMRHLFRGDIRRQNRVLDFKSKTPSNEDRTRKLTVDPNNSNAGKGETMRFLSQR